MLETVRTKTTAAPAQPIEKLCNIPKPVATKATFANLPVAARESLAKSEGFPSGSGHLIPGHTEVSKKAIARVLSDVVASKGKVILFLQNLTSHIRH